MQLERASQPDLMAFIVFVTIGLIFYGLADYLRACILCFQLKGPPAHFLIGNVMAITRKDCKLHIAVLVLLCSKKTIGTTKCVHGE